MVHQLKIEKEYLKQIISKDKKFEIRYNDRGFQSGDYLCLITKENDLGAIVSVGYIFYGREDGLYGIKPGTCVMSIELLDYVEQFKKTSYKKEVRELIESVL